MTDATQTGTALPARLSENLPLLSRLKEKFNQWLYIEDEEVIDVMLAAVVANKFKDRSIWLFLVAPPSYLKTELLLTLSELPETHMLSKLSSKTLLSGSLKPENSLLYRLTENNKHLLILKDFTTILEMEGDSRSEIMAQLREIADGSMSMSTGSGRDYDWRGHLGMIAGVTPVIDISQSLHNSLGSRFLFYRIPLSDRRAASMKASSNVGQQSSMQAELKAAVNMFFSSLQFCRISDVTIPPDMNEKIVDMAEFTAFTRCGVMRDMGKVLVMPEPEGSGRLAGQLTLLAKALAIIRGRNTVNEVDIKTVVRLCVDTSPKMRVIALRGLYGLGQFERIRTRELSVQTKIPAMTIKETLEDMTMIGIVERELEEGTDAHLEDLGGGPTSDNRPYNWHLTQEFRDLIARISIFEGPRPQQPELPRVGVEQNGQQAEEIPF